MAGDADRLSNSHRVVEQVVRHIAAGVSAETGDKFFRSLTAHLAQSLAADYALVGAAAPDGQPHTIHTLAIYAEGRNGENFAYSLADTPCENVVNQGFCFYPDNVQQLFPKDRFLQDFGAAGYAGTPLRDAQGRVVGIISVLWRRPLRDPAPVQVLFHVFGARAASELERQRYENALQASEAKYRALVEQIPAVTYMLEATHGSIERRYISPQIATLLGFSPEEWIADPTLHAQRLYPDDREWVQAVFAESRRTGEPVAIEYRLLRRDGRVVWVRDTNRMLTFPETGGYVVHGVVFDISAERDTAERLQQLDAQLAHVARLSTLGEMVAGIAHEINQPLSAIANFAQACRNVLDRRTPPGAADVRAWVASIDEQSRRAGEIIQRLRRFVVGGQTPRQVEDLHEIVRESADLLAFVLRQHRVRIEWELHAENPHVCVDRVQIQQVLINLLRNAVEAGGGAEDSPRVVVRTASDDRQVRVEVADFGPGLSEEAQRHMFTPFFTTKPHGMGMGLPISRTIVEAHGGQIRVAANTPRGAVVGFTLPRALQPQPSQESA